MQDACQTLKENPHNPFVVVKASIAVIHIKLTCSVIFKVIHNGVRIFTFVPFFLAHFLVPIVNIFANFRLSVNFLAEKVKSHIRSFLVSVYYIANRVPNYKAA